jgi:hypothetical protein
MQTALEAPAFRPSLYYNHKKKEKNMIELALCGD